MTHGSKTVAAASVSRNIYLSISALLMWASILLLPSSLWAQSSASVSGSVVDPSGSAVTGANITLKNTDTNVQQGSVTSSSGTYAIINIPPGNYSIDVSKEGFSTAQLTHIVLGVNQAASFNFTMTVGAVTQQVSVSADAATVESTTSELGTVIGTRAVNNLPLNGRNFTQLLELTPGVSPVSVGQNSGGGGGFAGQSLGQFTFPSVNGARNRSNMFLLDGVSDLGSFIGNYNYQPIVDDIQEFKVQSHNDLAEFGQVAGGIVNVVTKSGTNQLHGTVWEYLRNSAFDARNYFLPVVNPLRQNQFGVAAGGPIVIPHVYNGRNKTFFFFSYEGFRQSQATQSLITTPTAAQLTGDFSGDLAKGVVIYNPYSTTPDPSKPGQYLRTAFANNQIPQSLLSPAALLYAKTLFPAPNLVTAGGQNLADTTPSRINSNSYTGRIDQSFGEHDQLFGRVSYYDQPSTGSGGFPGFATVGDLHGYNVAVHESHTFNPTTILELYFGRNFGDDLTTRAFPNAPSGFAQQLIGAGFSSAFLGGFQSQSAPFIPLVGISGYIGSGTGNNNVQDTQIANTYQFGGSFTKILGRHTLKAGGVYATNNSYSPISGASLSTSTFQTSNLENPTSATGAPTGDALASFLLGVPTSAQRRDVIETLHHGMVNGVFAQDQIQINQKLAINVGLRWDVTVWPIYGNSLNADGYVGDLDLSNGTYLISATPPPCSTTVGAPCIPGGALPANVINTPFGNRALHQTDFSNYQPRVGFAYHPLEKTSVLAGYSRFYDNWNSVVQYSQNAGGNWPSVNELNQNTLNTTTPNADLGNPLSQGTGTITTTPASPFTGTAYYFDPRFKTPLTDQWNLQVEQGFGSTMVLNLGYVGSHSSKLDLGGLYNTAQFAAAGTADQVAARRQFPYITPTNYDKSSGNANFNAFEVSLKKSTSNGLTYLVSYTWSKAIDLASSGSFGSEGTLLQNPYDPQHDRSVSGFDLRHSFSASVNYELPIGRGKMLNIENPIANSLLGGWLLNGIGTVHSGSPYSVTVNGDIANTGNTFVEANLVGNPTLANRTPTQWFNTAAFTAPPANTFGNSGRNILLSDDFKNLDISAFKSFTLPRETAIQFRAEAFNLFNHAVFAAPDSTVGDSNFGTVSSTANNPRQLQFAVKLTF